MSDEITKEKQRVAEALAGAVAICVGI